MASFFSLHPFHHLFHFISFHHLTTVLSHIFKKTEPTWKITCTCLGNSIPGQSKWEKKNLRQESIKSIKGNALLCWILLDNELWRDSMCTELAIQVDSGLTVERSHALQQSIRWKKKKKVTCLISSCVLPYFDQSSLLILCLCSSILSESGSGTNVLGMQLIDLK